MVIRMREGVLVRLGWLIFTTKPKSANAVQVIFFYILFLPLSLSNTEVIWLQGKKISKFRVQLTKLRYTIRWRTLLLTEVLAVVQTCLYRLQVGVAKMRTWPINEVLLINDSLHWITKAHQVQSPSPWIPPQIKRKTNNPTMFEDPEERRASTNHCV